MSKTRHFRIKYYDYNDSELYTIIQVAPNIPRAVLDAIVRIERTTNNFKIMEPEEISNPEYYIREIRKILTTPERNETNWLRRKRRATV